MLNAIYEIGKKVADNDLSEERFIKNICLPLEKENRNKQKQHIVFLNFNTETKKIEIDFEEINAEGKNTAKEYLWIGNQSGNNKKIYLTSDNFENIILSVVNNAVNEILIERRILNDFFIKKKYIEKNKEKIEFLLKANSLSNNYENILELKQQIIDETNPNEIKKQIKKYNKELEKLFIQDNLKPEEIAIYSLKINGVVLCKNIKYIDTLYYDKIGALYDEKGKYKSYLKKNNICSICRKQNTNTTSNLTNISFKYYMTDKLGFSSNLDGKFVKNFNICESCYKNLMIAEKFIEKSLKVRIGGLNSLIIPYFLFENNFDFREFTDHIKTSTLKITDINSKVEEPVKDYIFYEDESNLYNINFLFFEKEKSAFKVLKLIKDIPPTRINTINNTEEEIKNLVFDKFDEIGTFIIDLNTIWGCIPVKIDKKSKKPVSGISKYLDLLDNIFSNKPIDYEFVIKQAIETIRIIKYETKGYNIWVNQDIAYKILQLNFLLLFLKKLKLTGGQNMEQKENDYALEMIPDDIRKFWINIEVYNDNAKKGLFLLGYLLGEIGTKQQSAGIKNKPVLNKLNFQGMSLEKTQRLTGDVFEKLRQYKILNFNENTFAAAKFLIDNDLNNWTLSNQENIFYILSGYAFSNYLIRKKSKEKYKELLKEKIDFIKTVKEKGHDVSDYEHLLTEAKEKAEHKYYNDAIKILKSIKE